MSQEDVPDLEFVSKLLLFEFSSLGDLDHETWMDLIHEGDGSFPDPMHAWIMILDGHDQGSQIGLQ